MSEATFEITIETTFAAAHALRLPDGSDEPTHGHNWHVRVTVARAGLDAMATVMDFHDLERVVHDIVAPWHNRTLNDVAPFAGGAVNPSAERVAECIGQATAQHLPTGVTLERVEVGEAPGCTATYRPASPGTRETPGTHDAG